MLQNRSRGSRLQRSKPVRVADRLGDDLAVEGAMYSSALGKAAWMTAERMDKLEKAYCTAFDPQWPNRPTCPSAATTTFC